MHWDHEPSLTDICRICDKYLSWDLKRFMESPLRFETVHWAHEPTRPRARPRRQATHSTTSRTTRTRGRFMENLPTLSCAPVEPLNSRNQPPTSALASAANG